MSMHTDTLYVCSSCGSPSVEFSALVGGAASCKACHWTGPREELVGVPFENDALGGEAAFLAMYNDFRRIFAQQAVNFLRFLVKWGFVDAEERAGVVRPASPAQALKYINAIARGALQGVIQTREELERLKKEKEAPHVG
jgi:hypothetical protein